MKIIKSTIIVSVVLALLGFAAYFSPSKPLSIVKDIGQMPISATIDGAKAIAFKENLYFLRDTQETGEELWRVDKFNNVSLALETIPGRESATIKTFFESENILYLIVQVPNKYTNLIYYLEEPQGEFIKIDLELYINHDNMKVLNGKYFTLTESGNNANDTIIEFDGPDTKYHTISGNHWYYAIEDFTYFNNELYYSFRDTPLRELRKIASDTEETVYSGSHVISNLFATVDGIYFIESNYDTTPVSYNLNLLQENEAIPVKNFSSIDFGGSQVIDGKLILLGTAAGSPVRQLWQFKGVEQKQLTEYQEKHFLGIEDLTGAQGDLYFVERSSEGEKLKYHDGVDLYDVAFTYDSLNQGGDGRIFTLNGQFLISGGEYQGGNNRQGVSILNKGVATEVLEGNNISYVELFEMADEIYALSSKNSSEIELYNINAESKTADLETKFSGEYAGYIASDEVNKRIYLKYREPDEFRRSLSVIEGSSAQKLYITNATGSSRPRNYTAVEGKTYFIANHDEYGDTIWESDGYDAKLLEAEFNENPNLTPDKLFNVDGHLVFTLKKTDSENSQVWVLKEGDFKRLSQKSFNYIESSITNTGSEIYMIAGSSGSSVNKLFTIKPDQVEFIDELDFVSTNMELIKTPKGTFFTTGYDEYTGVWQIDSSSLIEIDKNGVEFTASHHRDILWDSNNVYIKECIDDYDTALYKITAGNKLEEVDLGELSGKHCTNTRFHQLDNEIVISLIDHYGSESLGIWALNGGKVAKVDSLGVPFNTKFVIQDSRLYFNATPLGAAQRNLYVYENGAVKNLNLEPLDILRIAKEPQDDNIDWLFYKEQHANNGYQLYRYDGTSLRLHDSIPKKYHDVYKIVKVGNINFIQVGNSGGGNELIALDGLGELSYLNSDQSISFSTNGSYGDNLMANGHGKWLFLQGCNYLVGCEPYSLNLNQLPTASFKTDKNHYVAGYEVLIDGSLSTDPENNIVEYNWKLVDYDHVEIENNGTKQAVITLPLIEKDEDLTIELEIIDNGYDRSVLTKTISVEVNHAPEIVINAPNSSVEGSHVELNAKGTTDAEGELLGFQWVVVKGKNIALNNADKAIASFTVPNIEEESHITLRVYVTDTVGNTSHAEVNISLRKSEVTPDPDSGDSSGGGGSAGLLLLFLLCMFYLRRTSIE